MPSALSLAFLNNTMGVFTVIKGLQLLAVCAAGAAVYPAVPADLTTPVQQRLAINGPDSAMPPSWTMQDDSSR